MNKLLYSTMLMIAALGAPGPTRARPADGPPEPPRMLVLLVVDQMRADYIDRYGHQWTGGLRRLVERGAWFRHAAYPFLNTVTCAGTATIGTGTFPATHGVILNSWWDRTAARPVACTEDPDATVISYGAPVKRAAHSASRLEALTLADEMRARLPVRPRTVMMSLKARSIVPLAGRHADAIAWSEERTGTWVTSSAYASAALPFIDAVVKAHPVMSDLGQRWTLLLPPGRYLHDDKGTGEKPSPRGWTTEFPHVLDGGGAGTAAAFYDEWERSPFTDAHLTRLAIAGMDALRLGTRSASDLLAIGYSALDRVGHNYGPESLEVQDVLARLDRLVADLLGHLDRVVGPAHYVVALSADHGVSPIPEQMKAHGYDAGRILTSEVISRVQRALEPALGPGAHVARMLVGDLYFAPGVYARLMVDVPLMRRVREATLAVPGVSRVLDADSLRKDARWDDPIVKAATLSYFHGRSGDLIVVPKPYWIIVSPDGTPTPGSAATHGTAYAYDTRVPVVLMGPGIRPGQYLTSATPADIAPTLAFLAGITMSRSDGRVLHEALATGASRSTAPPHRAGR